MSFKGYVREKIKKICAVALSVVMLTAMLPTAACAQESVVVEPELYALTAPANVVKSFISEPTDTKEKTFSENPYGPGEYYVDEPFANDTNIEELSNLVATGTNLKLEVGIQVDAYNGEEDVLLVAYAQDRDYSGGSWKQTEKTVTSAGGTFELVLDLSSYTSIGNLGVKFRDALEGEKIIYSIEYACITGVAQADDKDDVPEELDEIAVLEAAGSTHTKIVEVNPYSVDPENPQYLIKNQFTLPKILSLGGLEGFSALKLKVSATIHDYTDGERVGDGAFALLYGMDGMYENWNQTGVFVTEKGQTVELVLDLVPVYTEKGTLGEVGFEVIGVKDGTPVNYTINYAIVEGKGSPNVEETTVDLKYAITGETKDVAFEDTAVGRHGKLSLEEVDGYTAPVIVDENGEPYQLRGVSSHGLSWFPQYVNKEAYQNLRDEWGMNMVRIAVYAREGDYGYVTDKEGNSTAANNAIAYNDEIIQKGVEAATELGMYVIIDWHVLNYNPNKDLTEASAFFEKYATMYKDYKNVLFEVCNEPNGVKWYDGSGNDLYTYCSTVADVIRDCGNDSLIICGTNSYSQDVDEVAAKPLSEAGIEDVLYTCHFYAATHYDTQMNKLKAAVEAGTPVMVSEYGVCVASGDGAYDLENADAWLDYCDANNISYACWAMSNSQESAAFFKTDCEHTSGWTEECLTVTSKYLINRYRDRARELSEEAVVDVFTDVVADAWYVPYVQYVYDTGMMSGTSATTFSPEEVLPRAQFITVLYNTAGRPAVTYEAIYSDVVETDYFAASVVWAYDKDIAIGIGDNKYGSDKNITREQLALMLYKYARLQGVDTTYDADAIADFPDADKVDDWAEEAIKWAVSKGVMSGKLTGTGTYLDPLGDATRAECATMMKNYSDIQ